MTRRMVEGRQAVPVKTLPLSVIAMNKATKQSETD